MLQGQALKIHRDLVPVYLLCYVGSHPDCMTSSMMFSPSVDFTAMVASNPQLSYVALETVASHLRFVFRCPQVHLSLSLSSRLRKFERTLGIPYIAPPVPDFVKAIKQQAGQVQPSGGDGSGGGGDSGEDEVDPPEDLPEDPQPSKKKARATKKRKTDNRGEERTVVSTMLQENLCK